MTDQIAATCDVCGAQPGQSCFDLRAHGKKPLATPHATRGLEARAGRFVGVREAARRLGLHENTIRNMIQDGRLIDARIPGTSFAKIDTEQIEALEAGRETFGDSVGESGT